MPSPANYMCVNHWGRPAAACPDCYSRRKEIFEERYGLGISALEVPDSMARGFKPTPTSPPWESADNLIGADAAWLE